MTVASFFSKREPSCAASFWYKGHRFSCAENSTTNQPRQLITPRTRVHIGDALHPMWKIQQRDMDQRRSYRQLHTTHRSPQRAGHLEHCAPPPTSHPHSNRMSAVHLESPFVEASTKVSTLSGARLLVQHVSHGTDRATPIIGSTGWRHTWQNRCRHRQQPHHIDNVKRHKIGRAQTTKGKKRRRKTRPRLTTQRTALCA